MPATGHKILVHAADTVAGAILSIKQLSEEAQEYRKKDSSTSEEVTGEKYLGHQQMEMFWFRSGFAAFTYSNLRKLSKRITEIFEYLPETLNLFAVPNEPEDLSSCDATDTEGASNDTSEEIAN